MRRHSVFGDDTTWKRKTTWIKMGRREGDGREAEQALE